MKHVNPWYVEQKSCEGCGEAHDLGPFSCRDDAVKVVNMLVEQGVCSRSGVKIEERAPLSNDQLVDIIHEHCQDQMATIATKVAIASITSGTPPPDYKKVVVTLAQVVTIDVFKTFRPGSTVEEMHETLGHVADEIGETVGGVQ